MKKFFKKVMLFLGISTMTLTTTTSCGVEDLLNEDTLGLISGLLGNIFGQGQSVSYQGNATCQYLYGHLNNNGVFETEGQTKEVQLSCTMEAQKSTNAVTVKIPSLTLRQDDTSITLTNVTLYNLAIDENGNLSLGDNTSVDGNILAPDGNTYPFANVYIERAYINENNLSFSGSLYFGEDMSRVMNISFTGAMVQQQNDPTGGFGGFGKY